MRCTPISLGSPCCSSPRSGPSKYTTIDTLRVAHLLSLRFFGDGASGDALKILNLAPNRIVSRYNDWNGVIRSWIEDLRNISSGTVSIPHPKTTFLEIRTLNPMTNAKDLGT